MTIKAKLIINVLLTAAIIGAISLSSYFSMHFLQEKLSYLTEKSTPFQMRTLKHQRELQECITVLVKVNAARTLAEYKTLQAEAEKSHAVFENTQKTLDKVSNDSHAESEDLLDDIMLELFTATEERIHSNNAATAVNTTVLLSMKESSARLDDLDSSISNLQTNYSRSFAAALENTETFSRRSRSIEDLRNRVRDLQLIAVTVQNAQNSSAVLIARGKLKAVEVRIAKNDYFKSNPPIAAVTTEFTDRLAEHIKLQSVAIAQKDDNSKNRASASGKDITYKLNDLFQTLDQETMLARDEVTLASGRQGNIFAQSNVANDILLKNSQLVALALMVTSETNQLFTLDSVGELDKREVTIRTLFSKIRERVQTLEISLTRLNALEELKMLRVAAASLAAVNTRIYSADGIVPTLKKKLNAVEKANKSADKLHDIVVRQTATGNESVSIAQEEQDKTIAAVNRTVRRSIAQIVGIGSGAIVIGIFIGLWIYRSVLRPLRMVLDAVRRQQKQGNEKARLAKAVAGGDLTREVTISETITLDPALIKRDEMGMVLNAVVGMSEAQIALDRAFAGMTAALRSSREEEARRSHLKNGLYELNKILRDEQKAAELADRALAFFADFLGAGVGIMYLYDEQGEMLQTLSTYAISRSKRLDWGFRLGEGLPGQVALERKTIYLNSVPPDYLPITSALGEEDPLNVVIQPIMHNDTLVGVVELGSFRLFDNDDFEFLNQSLEGIAIAINIYRSRQRADDFLKQTQQQAEEVRLQQEELQQSNEELAERAQMLAEQRNYNIY